MSEALVPPQLIDLGDAGVKSAYAVDGRDWTAVSRAYDAALGSWSALIPMCAPMVQVPAVSPYDDVSLAPSFRVWPRYQASHRLWFYSLAALGEGTFLSSFTDPSGGKTYQNVSGTTALLAHVETVSARTSIETTLTPSIAFDVDGTLLAIGCYELPRVQLAVGGSNLSTSDAGSDSGAEGPRLPITDDYAGLGAGFVTRSTAALRDTARRCGLFAGAPYAQSTSSTFAAVFQTPPIALGRFLYRGQTSSTMQLAAFVRASDATTTGEVRFTMASGAAVTLPFGQSTGYVRGQIAIDAEDLSAADGRRSTRDDTCTVELRRASGAGTVYLDTVTGGEGSPATVAALAATGVSARPRVFSDNPLPPFMGGRRRR